MRDILIVILSVSLLLVPSFSVFLNEAGASSSSFAPHKEFLEPHDTVREVITDDLEMLILTYTYEMNYEMVPEDMLYLLKGDYDPGQTQEKRISVKRPDGEDITLIRGGLQDDCIDSTLSVERSMDCRQALYHFGKEYNHEDPPAIEEVDHGDILFGKADKDILSDPEPLQGTYEFKVKIIGENIQIDFGEEKTNLVIISKEPSRPRELRGSYKDGRVNLEWDEPRDKGGSEIVQYNVYRATTLHYYEYVGNVTADKTSYRDDFDSEEIFARKDDKRKNLLYYWVVAVNKDFREMYLDPDSWEDKCFDLRSRSQSFKEIVHVSSDDAKRCDMSYKWAMNYSDLGQDYIEDRMNMDSIDINELRGGDVFFYDLKKINEKNGRREYEYQGGFFSEGDVDIDLSDGQEIDDNLDIHVEQSWIDFSGKLWAEKVSGDGFERLEVVKQSIKSKGQVNTSIDNTFDFNNTVHNTHWEVTKDIDMEWNLNLTIDYKGNNSWVIDKDEPTMSIPNNAEFDYSGDIDANVSLDFQDNKGYYTRDVEEDIHQELSSGHWVFGSPTAQAQLRTFSPMVGSANLGFYITLDETLPMNGSGWKYPLLTAPFLTNCQRDGFSMDKLYTCQYLDPLVLPGLGTLLGVGLKRANVTDQEEEVEVNVNAEINAALQTIKFDSKEDREQWIKENEPRIRKETWGDLLTRNTWTMDQQTGPSGEEAILQGAVAFEPLGYFASKPLKKEEIESYNQNREQFFENELEEAAQEEKEESPRFAMAFTAIIAILILCLVVLGYRERNIQE